MFVMPIVAVAAAATIVLGNLSLRSDIVVPALLNCLKAHDSDLKRLAIEAIGQFGTNVQLAVTALIPLLTAPEENIRSA